ncbi:hypothetical protein V1509DRAFT_643757 [Lipomyces kononenkoae]
MSGRLVVSRAKPGGLAPPSPISVGQNFGNSTTSRVEGSHGALKGAPTPSSGTLLTAGKKITVALGTSSR